MGAITWRSGTWKWGAFLATILFVVAYLSIGRVMYIVPSEKIGLVHDIHDRHTADPGKYIATLDPNRPVLIIECLNLVDDQVYRVVTDAGEIGYVADGRFLIERRTAIESLGGPRVICNKSCPYTTTLETMTPPPADTPNST